MTKINTRIAPSPTGDMHLGTARTAYFNWLIARATGGKFLLRIDDTDADRNKPNVAEDIIKIMEWLGLDTDETYRQTERKDAYLEARNILLSRGLLDNSDGAYRFVLPDDMDIGWHDDIAGPMPQTKTFRDQVHGMVLFRSDGSAVYHTASVVDDIHSNIDYVVRGTDHITNTFKQVAIFKALQARVPRFAHIGLITSGKKKLSKRDGAASMLAYKDKGVHPEAMLNFMLRLGWGPKVDDKTTSLIDKARAITMFMEGGRMKANPAEMDLAKLDSFHKKYTAQVKS